MKKRILFVITYLNTGGTVRSLQNFLNCYDASKFEVDVFSMVHSGAYKGQLCNCKVLPPNRIIEASVAYLENQRGVSRIESIIFKLINKITKYRFQSFLFKRIGKKLSKQTKYDAIVGYSEGLPTLFVSFINHPNKIGWIHCDYASYLKTVGGKRELNVYQSLRSIVCVSEFTKQSFVDIYPSLVNKTFSIYNILDDKMMRQKANDTPEITYDNTLCHLVSIGRIDPIKRLSVIPVLARKVLDAGCKIQWLVIGPKGTNTEFNILKENIVKYKVEKEVLLLGEKTNPYPYIAHANLLVNTSVSEACPYVINEAKILGTPVVCTDFGSANEFVSNGENGYIVPIEQMADCIVRLIQHPEELQKMRANLSTFSYENGQILRQIYSLV